MALDGMRICVVGGGVMGLHTAVNLCRRGASVTVLEKEAGLGGVWRTYANDHSRVQIAEPAYRLGNTKIEEDFTTRAGMIEAMQATAAEIERRGGRVLLSHPVTRVRKEGESVRVVAADQLFHFDHAILSCGGLQEPRRIELQGEDVFSGDVVYGVGGAPDRVEMKGKSVVVLGMGAFAIENAREALFRGASHVTIVARNRNLILPRALGYLAFVASTPFGRAMDAPERRAVNGVSPELSEAFGRSFKALVRSAGTARTLPGEREKTETIPTASDVFFIGHALGKMRVLRDRVASLQPHSLLTKNSGERITADVVIKCFGFEDPDAWIADVVGQRHVHSPMLLNERMWMIKGERARRPKGVRVDPRLQLNIPPAATVLAEAMMELFVHYATHPQALRELMDSGELPTAPLGQEWGSQVSLGMWPMMQRAGADVMARVSDVRIAMSDSLRERYSCSQFLRENREWWRSCCARITGRDDAVPYPFEEVMEMARLEEEAASTAEKASAVPMSRL